MQEYVLLIAPLHGYIPTGLWTLCFNHYIERPGCYKMTLTILHTILQAPIHIERPLEDLVFRSITLKTVHGRKIFHTWREIERIVSKGLYVQAIPLYLYVTCVH